MHLKNKLKQTGKARLQQPFLDTNGNIDKQKQATLISAHQEFKNNVERFINLYERNQKKQKLTSIEKAFYKEVEKLIIDYDIPSNLPLSNSFLKDYQTAVSLGFVKKYPDGSARFSKDVINDMPYDLHIYLVDNPEEAALIGTYTLTHPGEPKSKIIHFVYSFRDRQKLYDTKDTAYSSRSAEQQIAEYSSDIDSLAPELKQILAPKWCEYFSEFHEVEDYCAPKPKL
jgi:hypothetical protein